MPLKPGGAVQSIRTFAAAQEWTQRSGRQSPCHATRPPAIFRQVLYCINTAQVVSCVKTIVHYFAPRSGRGPAAGQSGFLMRVWTESPSRNGRDLTLATYRQDTRQAAARAHVRGGRGRMLINQLLVWAVPEVSSSTNNGIRADIAGGRRWATSGPCSPILVRHSYRAVVHGGRS